MDEKKNDLQRLLLIAPNIKIFLEKPKNKDTFEMLGIKEEDIPDIATLIDLKLIQSALNGDLNAKKYIDERIDKINKSGKETSDNKKLLIKFLELGL